MLFSPERSAGANSWPAGNNMVPLQAKAAPATTSPDNARQYWLLFAPPDTILSSTVDLPPITASVESCQPEPKRLLRVPSSKSLIRPAAHPAGGMGLGWRA